MRGAHFSHASFARSTLDSAVAFHHVVGVGSGTLAQLLSEAADDRGEGKALLGVRILVVDDYEDARTLLAAILEREGAEVTQAESVAEAMQALDQSTFGVLISDIGMPYEDGYDLIRRVRTKRGVGSKELPAVAVTAFSSLADREQALSAGFQEHLAKPVDMTALLGAVARLVTPSPMSRLD